MKKAGFILFMLSFLFVSRIAAQNTPLQKCEMKTKMLTMQRDSMEVLYFMVLSRLDSVVGDYLGQAEQIQKMNTEIRQLKTEINNLAKKKNDTITELAVAKKLISHQNILIQKMEAEIKRLSQKQYG